MLGASISPGCWNLRQFYKSTNLVPLAAPGYSLLLLAAPGCSWLLLAIPGCSWLLLALLAAPGCSWLLLAAPSCSWLHLTAPGCSWHKLDLSSQLVRLRGWIELPCAPSTKSAQPSVSSKVLRSTPTQGCEFYQPGVSLKVLRGAPTQNSKLYLAPGSFSHRRKCRRATSA